MDPTRQLATLLAAPSSSMQQQQLELQRWLAEQQMKGQKSANKWNALGTVAGGFLGGGGLSGLFS